MSYFSTQKENGLVRFLPYFIGFSALFMGLNFAQAQNNDEWDWENDDWAGYGNDYGDNTPLPGWNNRATVVTELQELSESFTQIAEKLSGIDVPVLHSKAKKQLIAGFGLLTKETDKIYEKAKDEKTEAEDVEKDFKRAKKIYEKVRSYFATIYIKQYAPLLDLRDQIGAKIIGIEKAFKEKETDPGYEFVGTFHDEKVHFMAKDRASILRNCRAELDGLQLPKRVKYVNVFGDDYRPPLKRSRRVRYAWSPDGLCYLAAANARLVGVVGKFGVAGKLDGTPFEIRGNDLDQVKRDILGLIPPLASSFADEEEGTREITILNEDYRPKRGESWTPKQLGRIVFFNIRSGEDSYVAVGTINGHPFYFSTDSRMVLYRQCLLYFREVFQTRRMTVYSIDVNDEELVRLFGIPKSPEEACTKVKKASESSY